MEKWKRERMSDEKEMESKRGRKRPRYGDRETGKEREGRGKERERGGVWQRFPLQCPLCLRVSLSSDSPGDSDKPVCRW